MRMHLPRRPVLRPARERDRITDLVRHYARLADADFDADGIAALFTADALWVGTSVSGTSDFGRLEGREAIREYCRTASSRVPLAHHIVTSPRVVLHDARHASGTWDTLVLMALADDRHATTSDEVKLVSANYEHDYVKQGGTWLFARVAVRVRFDTRLRAL